MIQGQVLLLVAMPVIGIWLAVRWVRRPDDRPRSVVIAVFAAYVTIVLAGTMFPIVLEGMGRRIPMINLIPFRGLFRPSDISREQALPNVLLGVPFGFLAFFVFERLRTIGVLLAGLGFFVGIELLQLVLVAVAPASPRTTDITDLLLNTIGVAIGIGLFTWFSGAIRAMSSDGSLPEGQTGAYLKSVCAEAGG